MSQKQNKQKLKRMQAIQDRNKEKNKSDKSRKWLEFLMKHAVEIGDDHFADLIGDALNGDPIPEEVTV